MKIEGGIGVGNLDPASSTHTLPDFINLEKSHRSRTNKPTRIFARPMSSVQSSSVRPMKLSLLGLRSHPRDRRSALKHKTLPDSEVHVSPILEPP